MPERSYTVAEIDELRATVRSHVVFGRNPSFSANGGHGSWPAQSNQEISSVVEDRVRTHMLAGHTAEDLRIGAGPTITEERSR